MLNWDDPLAATGTASRDPGMPFVVDRTETADAWSADTQTGIDTASTSRPTLDSVHVRPGHGLVSNADLMATAGAAPVVDPNP
ncbi:MAG: ribonucleotide-diphosphate reductase subunit beta, partial [Thiocapsa sp. C3-sup]